MENFVFVNIQHRNVQMCIWVHVTSEIFTLRNNKFPGKLSLLSFLHISPLSEPKNVEIVCYTHFFDPLILDMLIFNFVYQYRYNL